VLLLDAGRYVPIEEHTRRIDASALVVGIEIMQRAPVEHLLHWLGILSQEARPVRACGDQPENGDQ
jgi:hypothetical protein